MIKKRIDALEAPIKAVRLVEPCSSSGNSTLVACTAVVMHLYLHRPMRPSLHLQQGLVGHLLLLPQRKPLMPRKLNLMQRKRGLLSRRQTKFP